MNRIFVLGFIKANHSSLGLILLFTSRYCTIFACIITKLSVAICTNRSYELNSGYTKQTTVD